MKSLALSMLAIASMAAMSSCSSENDPVDEVIAGNQEKVEIKLSAGVVGIETKAPIGTDDEFTPSIVGWNETTEPAAAKTTPAWTTTPNAAIRGNASGAAITLTDKQYYDGNSEKHAYIRGYYPVGTLSNGVVTFTNTVGDQDVMMTSIEDAGTRSTSASTPTALTFAHKLSQLNFKIQKDESLQGTVTLTSITVQNVKLPTGFDITTGTINYADATNLLVSGITSQTIGDIAAAGNPIMIEPLSSTTLKLDVVTSQGTFNDINVTVDEANTNGGNSYTITLSFKQKEVTTTATVTPWNEKTGSGDVM